MKHNVATVFVKNKNVSTDKRIVEKVQIKNAYHAPNKSHEVLNKTPEEVTKDVLHTLGIWS